MKNDNEEISYDNKERIYDTKNVVVETFNMDNDQKSDDFESNEIQIKKMKNGDIFKNNKKNYIDIKGDSIDANNNIDSVRIDDIQTKNIVEKTESHIKTDNIEDNALEMEKSEEELKLLFDIIFFQKIFNKKKTKIISQTDYEFIIKIINKLKDKEFELFFRYLYDIKISIFEIIVNGFIEFSFNDENNENNILNIISKVISLFFNKTFFYFIYKKLSKYFRKHYKIDNIDSIKKFRKIFNVWKLLYNPSKIKSFYEYNNAFMTFFSKSNNDRKNITIDLKQCGNFDISIKFYSFPILNINKYNTNFYFFILYQNEELKEYIKYDDIFFKNNSSGFKCLSEIDELKFLFINKVCNIYFNGNGLNENYKKSKLDFGSISKIEILNNFIGYINSIVINNQNIEIDESGNLKKEAYEMQINNSNSNNRIKCSIIHNCLKIDSNDEQKYINIENIFSKEFIDLNNNKNNKNKLMKNMKKDLNVIKYYGGFECFIPLFKILKNIINELKSKISDSNDNTNEIKENLNQYINESIGWIKDILRIMIKMICLSEKNYQNFTKIIIPLLGSLSEIYHILSSNELNTDNYKSNLFNDEVFFILYIIVLNQNIPNNIKKAFGFIFGINENFNNFNFTMEPLIFNLKENKITNLDWYYFIIFYFIEFFLLYYDSKEKIPSKLIEQLNLILEEEQKLYNNNKVYPKILKIMEYLNDFVKTFEPIEKENIGINEKLSNYIIYMTKIFLNVETMKENKDSKYYNIFKDFLVKLSKNIEKSHIFSKKNSKILINNFKYYKSKYEFLEGLYDFLEEKDFISENSLLLEELIDYKKQYHHLMKELFIFNRLWSHRKLFFKKNSKEMKKSKLKYKNINYYTRNFQKPIIYPYLDYKNHYPEFSIFKINKDLYKEGCENTDEYNFDLDCPELDNFIQDRNIEKIEEIKTKEDIILENACFIKQQYHVKGDFFLSKNSENSFSIYFFSYPPKKQNDYKSQPNCNKETINESKSFKVSNSDLCYGSIFKCPDKECNRKIVIDSDDIRLMMKRIYFYRKSSIEIFTNTKAYFFNFKNEVTMEKIFDFIKKNCNDNYLPIKINNKVNGLLKINSKIFQKIDQNENFIDLIKGHISKGQLFEMSTFDLIILINLISNRSFNDLHQYPVFPLLYFYDKSSNALIQRNLNEHIGFQSVTEEAKKRKKVLKEIYDGSLDDYDGEDKNNEIFCLFNTHYSNIIYTSNYLIRLFPFSSLSIEFQGNGFDVPNRLFFSIQETFFNILTQKSDLRELIPEFFYLPEMFINLNCFNFGKRNNNNDVDDVDVNIQEILSKKNNIVDLDFEKNNKSKNETNNNLNNNDDEKYFLFVDKMKNKLESSREKIHNWLDLIFGSLQEQNSKNQMFFREESYIENKKEKLEKFINDDSIMKSVEFGVIPLKTISDKNSFKEKNYDYEYLDYKKEKKSIKLGRESSKKISDSVNTKNPDKLIYEKYDIDNYYANKNNDICDYWDIDLNIDFKINKENGDGELEIYKNGNLIEELMDHNDDILHIFYNKRLNMFAVSSKDGFIYVYIIPNKLFSVIKHPNNIYYHKVYLSSNPFPTIIAYDEVNKSLTSYSLSGIMIKKVKIKEKDNIEIIPLFNIYGGAFKDRLKIFSQNQSKSIFCNIPFFDKIDL